jgi:hypothetical protein
MNKKSGTASIPVTPIDPVAPHEADLADPGKVEEVKAEQIKTKSGKYGSEKAKPFKPAAADNASEEQGAKETKKEEEKKSWIEIELVGEDDKPIPGEKYKITLPDGSVDQGTLDQNGLARVEGFEAGTCKVTFPDLDKEAWEEC